MYYDDYKDGDYDYDSENKRTVAKQRAMLLLLMSRAYFGIIR